MATIKIKQPLPTQSIRGGVEFPAGTELTLTDEWAGISENARGRVILVDGQRHVVFDWDLAEAQREPEPEAGHRSEKRG